MPIDASLWILVGAFLSFIRSERVQIATLAKRFTGQPQALTPIKKLDSY
ncbi:hypothetical protein [Candidatus Pseudomonas adelgestsugas]|uniref:Uncharacterized protein n=1 Tax=Candidatus Pseudomonas adelgestsugas TaxID=1302376 RepID=A0ABX5R6Y1_9PSED|nr:hypothetical protein [Candidatus Pseudomonas adelgestsugas]QAX81392.1 hypothetical protein C3B55_00017 [Candidatus Pseudomonas adelgestsugas]